MMGEPQKQNLLGRPLEPEEIEILDQLAKFHHVADFKQRALDPLALNAGRSVVDIANFLRISDQPVDNWAKA